MGPHICMLKTHADIVSDFSKETAHQLSTLAEKHNFVIMEDRCVMCGHVPPVVYVICVLHTL